MGSAGTINASSGRRHYGQVGRLMTFCPDRRFFIDMDMGARLPMVHVSSTFLCFVVGYTLIALFKTNDTL